MNIEKYTDFIKKYNDIITESEGSSDIINEEPEVYIKHAIVKIKKKIESLFIDNDEPDEPDDSNGYNTEDIIIKKMGNFGKERSDLSLKDMGCKLESSDLSKNTKTHKSLTVKFSDYNFYYSFYVKISLKEAIELNKKGEELSSESIQRCYVKMKKISLENFEELGTLNRNVLISEIDEKFIIELKLELDDEVIDSDGDEEFKIEV